MTSINREKYDKIFIDLLGLSDSQDLAGLSYQSISTWDSVGHMALMAELEDQFAIEIDIDDIIDFSSYEAGLNILKKYGVEIDV